MNQNSIILVDEAIDASHQFERIHSENVLAPGYYWRLKQDFAVDLGKDYGNRSRTHDLHAGDVHLLLDVYEYEGVAHTVTILGHPRDGGGGEYKILVADFLANFEPEKDADAIRAKEQDEVMRQVSAMQEDMAKAQVNPMALPGMKEAVEKAVEQFEREQVAEVMATAKNNEVRTADLRKLHRRASRRSEAAGNPLTVRSVTISDQVGLMIAGGVDSQGLQELTAEAKKRIVVAETSSKWLVKKTEEITAVLKGLTPFYAEKGKVALARAKKAITYVKEITNGLASLKLYTGDGVDVVAVTEGGSALPSEPLTLVQAKRFMDEELAVWADVDESFDWTSQSQFFDALKTTPALVKQIFPTQRCVVSMAVTRRSIDYGRDISGWEAIINGLRNRAVFLLVRDGDNIHAVYSTEPSHEAASRLFPTQSEVDGPFRGIDGSKIGLQDVAFGASMKRFDDVALHYKRFLILLCGLDHRMRLFGDFYPQENSMQFMTLDFQSRYFRFLENDDEARLISDDLKDVDVWMAECNKAIGPGSRVVVTTHHGFTSCSPQLKRVRTMDVDVKKLPNQLIVSRVKKNHCVTVPTYTQWGKAAQNTAVVWLDGPECESSNWYLCMDTVRLEVIRRYIYSSRSRTANISWLRTFKRAEAILVREHEAQAELRSLLASAALENGVLAANEVDEAIEVALSAWRAAHNGADAPSVHETKAVHELLTLMFPADRLAQSMQLMVDDLIALHHYTPLKLCRTGKNRLVLYVEASQEDRAPYSTGVQWGWVKRVVIDVKKVKLSVASSSFVWLEREKPDASELSMREWPQLESWVHAFGEPCKLKSLEFMKSSMLMVEAQFADMLAQGRAQPCGKGIDDVFFESLLLDARSRYATKTYLKDITVVIPLGVMQDSVNQSRKGPEALFLYAATGVYAFVNRYGTVEQRETYKKEVLLNRFYSKALDRMVREMNAMKWTLIQVKAPFKKPILDNNATYEFPSRNVLKNSNKSGGLTRAQRRDVFGRGLTRAERRAKGGNPRHKSEQHTLSWSRGIEAILGLAPHLKHEFYKNQRKWRWASSEEPEVFDPKCPAYFDFSKLIWNAAQNRSHANKYFSTSK